MNIETLKDQGWVEFPAGATTLAARNFAKQFPTKYRCQCNDKPKIQIVLDVFDLNGKTHKSFELSLTGEAIDNEWVNLKVYSLTDFDNLESHCDKLLAAWEAVNMACERQAA